MMSMIMVLMQSLVNVRQADGPYTHLVVAISHKLHVLGRKPFYYSSCSESLNAIVQKYISLNISNLPL